MGILNVTPDSFAEPLRTLDPLVAIDAALRLEADGADLIDIGGEPSRPGASPVDAVEELRRVLPGMRGLAGTPRVTMSIDTYKALVAAAAVEAGEANLHAG